MNKGIKRLIASLITFVVAGSYFVTPVAAVTNGQPLPPNNGNPGAGNQGGDDGEVLGAETELKPDANGVFSIDAKAGNIFILDGSKGGLCKSFYNLKLEFKNDAEGKVYVISKVSEDLEKVPNEKPTENLDNIYDVCEIKIEGFDDNDLSEKVLKTIVADEWMTDRDLANYDLRFFYSDTLADWNNDTLTSDNTVTIDNIKYRRYEVDVEELSTNYSIAEKNTETQEEEEPEEENNTEKDETKEKEGSNFLTIFLVILAVLVALVVGGLIFFSGSKSKE
ncbi:hypothetical protein JW887_02415 [Candidatus Dojkabacteria bacterium]|nr:hypothetical protein [Candidatus Dojkabacteria bacterium]